MLPVVAASSTTFSSTGSTTMTVTYPTGIQPLQRLLVCVVFDGNPTTSGWPTGWVQKASVADATNACRVQVWEKIATGAESGSFNVTVSASEAFVGECFLLPYAHESTACEVATATGSSTNPDPPLLDPAAWATADTLWIAYAGGDGVTAFSGTVANYGTPVFRTISNAANGVASAYATRGAAIASDNPAVFTRATEQWVAATIAVLGRTAVSVTGDAALTGGGTLTADGFNKLLAGQVLAGQALCGVKPVDLAPPETIIGAAALTGAGALSAVGKRSVSSGATLTGLGALAGTGTRKKLGAAALTGTGVLAATGVRKKLGAATLTGLGSLTSVGRTTKFSAASLTGVGVLLCAADQTKLGAAQLSGTGSLAANARRLRKGAAALSGQGTLYASATSYNVVAGSAVLTGQGALLATGKAVRDVIIPVPLVEFVCGPTPKAGQHVCGQVFFGDRWVDYVYDLMSQTATFSSDQILLVPLTGTLELASEVAALRVDVRLQADHSAALELLSSKLVVDPLLSELVCTPTDLLDALERAYSAPAAPERVLTLTGAAPTSVSLPSAPTRTISLTPVVPEEG